MSPRARAKNGYPPKVCQRCHRPFEWRKKWARDWENVKYCSQACRAGRISAREVGAADDTPVTEMT